MRDIAHRGIDRRNAGPAIDEAFADITPGIDAQAEEYSCARRPFAEDLAREIAAAKHRRCEVRRFGDAIVSAPAEAIAAVPAARPGTDAACASARSANIRRALRWSGPLVWSLACRDELHRRSFDSRFGRDDGRRLALDVLRARAAILVLWLWPVALWRRRRRKFGRLTNVEHVKCRLRIRQIEFPGDVQEDQEQCRMRSSLI